MAKKHITFQPQKHRLSKEELKPIAGETTAYGLVVHPAICSDCGPLAKYGYWSVSDPETGALVANGNYPGRLGAISALVEIAHKYQKSPGGFSGVLVRGRARFCQMLKDEAAVKPDQAFAQNPVQSGMDRTTSGAIGQP